MPWKLTASTSFSDCYGQQNGNFSSVATFQLNLNYYIPLSFTHCIWCFFESNSHSCVPMCVCIWVQEWKDSTSQTCTINVKQESPIYKNLLSVSLMRTSSSAPPPAIWIRWDKGCSGTSILIKYVSISGSRTMSSIIITLILVISLPLLVSHSHPKLHSLCPLPKITINRVCSETFWYGKLLTIPCAG